MANEIRANVRKSDVILKYSKSSTFYLNTLSEYFAANSKLLEESLKQNHLYISQPSRGLCKICSKRLPKITDIRSHNVDYVFCSVCSHLNGKFEDTESFSKKLYIEEEGAEYATLYIDQNFLQRTSDIYLPKVDFLIDSLPPKKYSILDVGCGSGYFACASLLRDLDVSGIDVSKTLIDFGNTQINHHLNRSPLKLASEQEFFEAIVNSSAEIICAIGVIEHLRSPNKFFAAFKKSKAKYCYYSVPMFSLSVALENVFKNTFPRQLSGGHTHLFTESSIKKMNNLLGAESIAEWRFGTDVMDLFRHILINLQENSSSQKMIDFLYDGLGKRIDDIQAVFDKHHFCSEIHLIARRL
jgi:2-polyprenyl-3-methyl-5-hydroxy-6-metoxy-1,4-benzoquinol methylase